MNDLITALIGTPIPTLLVIGGFIFLFLGLATIKKPIVINVQPPSNRKIAIIFGIVFVGAGVYLLSQPPSEIPGETPKGGTVSITKIPPLERLTYEDDHLGWAGTVAIQNGFDFYVDKYSSDYQYFLKFQVVLARKSPCVETKGIVSIKSDALNNVVWNWNNTNVNCFVSSEWPSPNEIGLTPEFVAFAKGAATKYGSVDSIDITPFIMKNGKYTVTWQYTSGCCGVVINGMILEAVPVK